MTKERGATPRPYHHGDLREALLEAAEEIVREGALASLTLREAARRAGVSHNAPYSHFASKQELLGEIGARGFDALAARLAASSKELVETDPAKALIAVGVAYVTFGLENEGLFRLMFSGEVSPKGASRRQQEAAALAFGVLRDVIDSGTRSGAFAPADRAALAAWALMHGLITLLIERRADLPRDAEEAAHVAEEVARIFLAGVRAPPR